MLKLSPWTLILAAAALVAPMLSVGTAEAQFRRGVSPPLGILHDTRTSARLRGFLFPDYYCSYKRYPNRECSADAHGHQRCRVTSWRLEQTCQ